MSSALELKVLFTAVDRFVRPVKAITGAAGEAAKALRENTARMKELNRTVDQIDAFKKAEKDAAITANTFAKTHRQIDELKAAIDRVGVPTKAQAAELANLTRKSEELRAKHESLTNTEQRLFEKLKAAGVDTAKLAEERRKLASASAEAANASGRLQAALEAENQKMRRLKAAQADLNKAKEQAGKLQGAGAGMLAGGAAANAAAAVPIMAYANAEDSATQLKIAMMQAGGTVSEQFREINDLAEKLGNRLPGTTSDFQDMMTMLIRQGMPAKNILGGLGEATAYLGVQLKMQPTAAAAFASKLQDATRTADKDMMGLMDTIQKTYYLGVDQNNMLQGFAKLSPALTILRKEGAAAAKELAPLLVMTDQMGMVGEASGNAFRKIFQKSMDTDKIKKIQDELSRSKGIKLDLKFTDGAGEFGGLENMYGQLSKLKSLTTETRLGLIKDIFGDDAEVLQSLNVMIEKGLDGYREVQAKMDSQAAIQDRVNAQLGTLKNLWDAAAGTFTNALVAFGESIAPELHATAEWLGKVTERTQAWAKENPGLSAGLMHVVKWTGLALLILGGLTVAAGAVLVPLATMKFYMTTLGIASEKADGKLSLFRRGAEWMKGSLMGIGTRVLPLLSGTFASLSAVIMATPIGWIIAGVATLAATGVLLYTQWEPIKAFFSGFWSGLTKVAGPALSTLWNSMSGFFSKVFELLGMIPGWSSVIVPIFKVIAGGIGEVYDWLSKLLAPTNAATEAAGRLGDSFGRTVGEILAKFLSLPTDLMNIGAQMIDGWITGIRSRWDSLRSTMHELAMGLPEWVRKALDIHSPSRVFAEIGMHTMAGLENGITDNEDGPLKALSGAAKKLTAIGAGIVIGSSSPVVAAAPAGAGSSGGNTYHITIQAPAGSDNQALADLVAREIDRIEAGKSARQRSRLRDIE